MRGDWKSWWDSAGSHRRWEWAMDASEELNRLTAENAELRLDAERMRDTQKDFGSLDDVLRAITRRYPDDPYASYLTDRLINGIDRAERVQEREAIVTALLSYRSACSVSDRWNALAYEYADRLISGSLS